MGLSKRKRHSPPPPSKVSRNVKETIVTPTERNDDDNTNKSPLWRHLAALLEPHNNVDDVERIRFLLAYLKQPEPASTAISHAQVAQLLLPWAIGRILSSAATTDATTTKLFLALQTLRQSLECILVADTDVTGVDNFKEQQHNELLSQSTVSKLCPKLLSLAMHSSSSSSHTSEDRLLCEEEEDTLVATAAQQLLNLLFRHSFYRPPFDLACDRLLLPLATDAKRKNNTSSLLSTCVVRWLESLAMMGQQKQNPKTIFTCLSRYDVLSGLAQLAHLDSDVQDAVSSLCNQVLFNDKVQLGGFYSALAARSNEGSEKKNSRKMRKKEPDNPSSTDLATKSPSSNPSQFISYQQDLLRTVDDWITEGYLPGLRMLSTLYGSFLDMTSVEDCSHETSKQFNKKSRRKRTDPSAIRYRLFSRWSLLLLATLEERDPALPEKRDEIEACLEAFHGMLRLLQQFKTHHEKNRLLSKWVSQLMRIGSASTTFAPNVFPVCVTILRVEHTALHPEIPRVLQICLREPSHSVPFLCCLFETYQLLRQQSFAFSSVLNAGGLRDSLFDTIRFDHKLRQSVAATLTSSCPIEQVDKIFLAIEEGVRKEKHPLFTLELFALFCKHLVVDLSSASALTPLCQRLIRNLPTVQGQTIGMSLQLCAHAMDLYARSCFWTDQALDSLALPQELSTLFQETSELLLDDRNSVPQDLLGALLPFSCQMLRRLHSVSLRIKQENLGVGKAESDSEIDRTCSFFTKACKVLPNAMCRIPFSFIGFGVPHRRDAADVRLFFAKVTGGHLEAHVSVIDLSEETNRVLSAFPGAAPFALTGILSAVLAWVLVSIPKSVNSQLTKLFKCSWEKDSHLFKMNELLCLKRESCFVDGDSLKCFRERLVFVACLVKDIHENFACSPVLQSFAECTEHVIKLDALFLLSRGENEDDGRLLMSASGHLRSLLAKVVTTIPDGVISTEIEKSRRTNMNVSIITTLVLSSAAFSCGVQTAESLEGTFQLLRCLLDSLLKNKRSVLVHKIIQEVFESADDHNSIKMCFTHTLVRCLAACAHEATSDAVVEVVRNDAQWMNLSEQTLTSCEMKRHGLNVPGMDDEAAVNNCFLTSSGESIEDSFVMGCLVYFESTKLPDSSQILQWILRHDPSDLIVQGVFCTIASRANVATLSALTNQLTDSHVCEEYLKFAPLILLLFQRHQDEKNAIFDGKATRLFRQIIRHVSSRDIVLDDGTFETSMKLLDHLVRSYDLMQLKEFDLAVILSTITGVLGNIESSTALDHVFALSSRCLSSMFQRYSKLMYACVPCVIQLFEVFQLGALNGACPDTLYCGLCDLLIPHKNIYKKHLVGLLVNLIRGFSRGISFDLQECLSPAVFSILDCMTAYESQQVIAFLSPTDKARFRSLFERFQNKHVYRGR